MTTTAITADSLPAIGYNLTDSADYTTMTSGAGNGVEFAYDPNAVIVLNNDSGAEAVYTFKTPTTDALSAKGITTPDAAVTVANGKIWLYKLASIFKQSDGDVIVECDQTAKILVLSPA